MQGSSYKTGKLTQQHSEQQSEQTVKEGTEYLRQPHY